MADLKPVLPTVIGRPQTARRSAPSVRMPNSLEGMGDGLRNLANGLPRLAGAIAGYLEERDDADYKRVLNEATAEANQRYNDEVLSATGFSAGGSPERAAKIYEEVAGKYRSELSGRNQRRFDEEWGARRNSRVEYAMRFESSQQGAAKHQANQSLMKSGVESYAMTVDPNALKEAKRAYDDDVRDFNGGRLVTPDTFARFEADFADGNKVVKLPDRTLDDGTVVKGKTFRIVDEKKPNEKDTITRTELETIRENLKLQSDAYQKGLQNLYDSAHAQVIERYLKDDRLTDAEAYVKSISAEGYPQGVSKAALAEFQEAIGRKREAADISTQTTQAVSGILAKAGPESQRYGSPEQDQLFTEVRRDVVKKYAGEKWKTGAKIVSALDVQYRMLQDRQRAALASDTVSALKQMQDSGLTLAQQASFIQEMKDSPLKAALQKAWDRKAESYNNSSDPFFVADQERRLNAFKLALGNGFADLDGVHYDFSDQEQLKAYILNLGFTERNQKRAGEYMVNSESRIDAALAGKVCARLLGITDPAEALSRYPNLLAELDELKGSTVIEPSKMENWLRTNITSILSAEVSKDRTFWRDPRGPLGDMVGDRGYSADQLYMDRDQLTAAWRRFQAQEALNRGDQKEAARVLDATPTAKELEDFARRRGYHNNKGLYYLRGGK